MKTVIWKWVLKFKEKLNITPVKRLVAVNETGVKVNGDQLLGVRSVKRRFKQLIAMRVYPSGNIYTSKLFIAEVLKCEGKPTFIIDGAQWLNKS